jgi:Raf kinase inhibitor-like YbhB/YbcL family protein
MKLTSSAMVHGTPIPRKYTGDGQDISPPLAWEGAPSATKEFLLICEDPDAPSPQPWVHWLLYGIPANVRAIPERVAAIGIEGQNSWKTGKSTGYRGPAPPKGHGVHHYHFRLYALDAALHLPLQQDKSAMLRAAEGHILAEAELIGTYERK